MTRVSRWRSVRHGNRQLFDVGIEADGSLYNPNGYPDDVVRAAVLAADERRHARRSAVAKLAAQTRRARTERRVYDVAKRIVAGHVFGPGYECAICGRGLSDRQSIERGIGSECWQSVLDATARMSSESPL